MAFETTEIFRFHDGYKDRGVDPLKAQRKINSTPEINLEFDVKALELGQQPEASAAAERLIKASRAAFALPEWNEEDNAGITEMKCLEILYEFGQWMDKKKESTEKPPTSAKFTEQDG